MGQLDPKDPKIESIFRFSFQIGLREIVVQD